VAHPLRSLIAACHPGPVVAVTTIATLLALAVDATVGTVALVFASFFVGQLSIGWSNDWIDAERDAAAGRADKPVAVGAVSTARARTAAIVAAAVTVPLSLALGWLAGASHLVLVAAGWAYNAGLKATVWSWAPYFLAFGLLPAVVVLASTDDDTWPPLWMMAAGGLLGVGAHLLNVLPDLEDDRLTGVRGLPHRLGRTGAGVLAPVVLVGASVLVVAGPAGEMGLARLGVLLFTAGVAAVAAIASVTGRRLLALVATATVAVADVALLVSGGALVG
jgi:4-hydroxybenzoate polyprenyltransferase